MCQHCANLCAVCGEPSEYQVLDVRPSGIRYIMLCAEHVETGMEELARIQMMAATAPWN